MKRTSLSLLSLFLLLNITLTAFAQESVYKTLSNIPYYNEDIRQKESYINERCNLDIYYPTDKKGFATIIWIHGGGLTGGNKELPGALMNKGICIVGVNYRLAPRVKAPAYIEDAAAAVAWVFKHIGNYGGDASQISCPVTLQEVTWP